MRIILVNCASPFLPRGGLFVLRPCSGGDRRRQLLETGIALFVEMRVVFVALLEVHIALLPVRIGLLPRVGMLVDGSL